MIATGRATLYELSAEHSDGRRLLVCYACRRTRRGLYNALADRLDHVRRVFGTTDITFAKRAADGATMGDWRIVWTGRTQRDAVHGHSELTYIGDA